MPRLGGEADKIGNRYEATWTVDSVLDLLNGHALSICVEPFGDDSLGVEFKKTLANGCIEFHSVKRQTSGGNWTLTTLSREQPNGRSILGDLYAKVSSDSQHVAVFVSSTGAHQLSSLKDAVNLSNNPKNLQQRLQQSADLKDSFEKIEVLADGSEDAAFQFLKSLRIAGEYEDELTRRVEEKVMSTVYRPDNAEFLSKDVRLLLSHIILARLGQVLSADIIWEDLNSSGYDHRDWSRSTPVRDRIRAINEIYLRDAKLQLICGTAIVRDEAIAIVGSLCKNGGPKCTLIAGTAGRGKTCVIAQVLSDLQRREIPALVLRMDNLPDVLTSLALGNAYMLPASPTTVLAGVAHGQQAVLIIDQLDAISMVSGRNPKLWAVFDELRREVALKPNLRLLMACRSFDLQHDFRLRQIAAEKENCEQIDLKLLDDAVVKQALVSSGNNPDGFNKRQLELLRLPIHLYLLISSGVTEFNGIQDLYDAFWQHKQHAVRRRCGHDVQWTEIIDALADYLNTNQVLSAPKEILDNFNVGDVNVLVSEHVLRSEQGSYGFFHESFFDYAFARKFARSNADLTEFLATNDQHLFRRAQVRQILAYQRGNNNPRYLATLKKLLNDSRVRYHLKKLALAWLGQLERPIQAEWEIIKALEAEPTIGQIALMPIWNSVGWFDLLDESGVWEAWLHSGDEKISGRALGLLNSHHISEHRSSRIAALIRPFVGKNQWWNVWLISLMAFGDVHHSREMFDIFLQMVDDGIFDGAKIPGASNSDWWHLLYASAEERPDFTSEAIAHWLDHNYRGATFDFRESPLSPYSQSAPGIIEKCSSGAPVAFVQHLLPAIARAVMLNTKENTQSGRIDSIWGSLRYESNFSAADALRTCMADALEWLAQNQPEVLDVSLKSFECESYATLEFLILRGWTANGARYSDKIIEYLLSYSHRLEIGYFSLRGGSEGAVARAAIAAASPYCSIANHLRLDEALLRFNPSWERKPQSRGRLQLFLLEAISIERRSDIVRARIDELRRKFPHAAFVEPAHEEQTGFITSPIKKEKADLMTDKQWLCAMEKYGDTNREGSWEPDDSEEDGGGFIGGARQLADVLQHCTAQNPNRFGRLFASLPDQTLSNYFLGILQGLVDSERAKKPDQPHADNETLFDVIRRAEKLVERPCAEEVCRLIAAMAKRQLPDDLIAIVCNYARGKPSPEEERWRDSKNNTDPYTNGINTLRGAAVETITALLFADTRRAVICEAVIHELISDRSLAVRACLVHALTAWINVSRKQAVAMFVTVCNDADEMLGTMTIDPFLQYTYFSHYDDLRSVLQRMLRLGDDKAIKTAAVKTCLAAFNNENAEEDAMEIRSGNDTMRAAAADVYATNLCNDTVGILCAPHLKSYFSDHSSEVRKTAAGCFSGMNGTQLRTHENLIREYLASPAFADESWSLITALEQSCELLPAVVLDVAKRATTINVDGDPTRKRSLETDAIVKLVMRVYQQTDDGTLKTSCLDLIDEMERLNFYGVAEQLMAIER
jgi:hypothetical protein